MLGTAENDGKSRCCAGSDRDVNVNHNDRHIAIDSNNDNDNNNVDSTTSHVQRHGLVD